MARWLQRPCDFFASVVSPSGDITSRLLFSRGPDPTLDAVLRGILTHTTDYLLYDLSYTTCVMRFFLTVPCSANYVWVHLLFHDECCGNGILDGYDASPKRHGGNLLLFFSYCFIMTCICHSLTISYLGYFFLVYVVAPVLGREKKGVSNRMTWWPWTLSLSILVFLLLIFLMYFLCTYNQP